MNSFEALENAFRSNGEWLALNVKELLTRWNCNMSMLARNPLILHIEATLVNSMAIAHEMILATLPFALTILFYTAIGFFTFMVFRFFANLGRKPADAQVGPKLYVAKPCGHLAFGFNVEGKIPKNCPICKNSYQILD